VAAGATATGEFMTDFGGTLRRAREQRGISVREISARTKISIAALEALERNDVSKLPGGIFSRAFVRAYAHEVGLDPDETVREFLARFHVSSAPVPSPAVVSPEESQFAVQQRMAGVVLKLVLVSVPLIGLVLYFSLRTPPAQEVARGATASEAVPATADSPEVRPVATSAVSVPSPAIAAPGTMTLEVRPTGDCWVRITADGRPVLARLMKAGDEETREFRDAAVILIGDAGTFAFSIDGRPGKPIGQPGEVRTVRLTRETIPQYVHEP
jgi:cytoskeleton protein RodZ